MDDTAKLTPPEEALLAPVSMEAYLMVNGTKTGTRWYISQAEWDGAGSDEAREEMVREAFKGTGNAFVEVIHRENLMHPEG